MNDGIEIDRKRVIIIYIIYDTNLMDDNIIKIKYRIKNHK